MKRLLLLFVAVSSASFAAQPAQKESAEVMQPWSKTATDRLKKGLVWTLTEGNKIHNYSSNGVYKVCLGMQERLQKAEPHQMVHAKKALHFLKAIETDSQYTAALTAAKQKHAQALADEKLKSEADSAWTAFRISAAKVLTQHVAKQSPKLTFNTSQDKIKDLFTMNADLDPASQDGINLEAATLALYGLMDVQEREKALVK